DFGEFDLELDIAGPEDICDDLVDNDFDGYLDCDDATSCQTLPDCKPGKTVTGQPCFENTQCTANHNDPICLHTEQFPKGYCRKFCAMPLQDCSDGNICYAGLHLSVNGVCLHSCTTNTDCASG